LYELKGGKSLVDAQERTLDIFENDEKLIAAAKQLLEVNRKMEEDAKTDPAQAPTPQRLADALGITVEGVTELIPFAKNDLGSYELDYINAHKMATITDNFEIIR
jgi:hypothetical protein